jgi:hypothetical protein
VEPVLPTSHPKSVYSRILDGALLAVLVASLVTGLVRFAIFGMAVSEFGPEPFADFAALREPFTDWWGARNPVFPDGGDYLAVLSRKRTDPRTLNYAIGAALDRAMRDGTPVARLVVPDDAEALGIPPTTSRQRQSDGSERVRESESFNENAIRLFSPVPVERRSYSPTLTDEDVIAVGRSGVPTAFTPQLRFVRLPEGGSGMYLLMATSSPTVLYLIPAEIAPVEVAP